jgi:flagellar hook-associated protein 3 FlgL
MSFDRVTKASTRATMLSWLEASQRRMADRQLQVATGRRLTIASDNPSDALQALDHRRQVARLEQFGRNSDAARSWVDTSSSALTGASNALIRARTLMVQASTSIHTTQSRAALASEVRAIADELIGIANTAMAGRPVFAGDGAGPAFAPDGTYTGGAGSVVRTLAPGDDFTVGRRGDEIFGNGAASVFQLLRSIADAIDAGDSAAVRAGLDPLDAAGERIMSEVGRLGSLSSRLDAMAERRELQALEARRRVSDLQDADIAQAIINLRSAEASYQATLATTARMLSTSLLDFLR